MTQHAEVHLKDLDPTIQKLIAEAKAIRARAYCPYSSFAVGAAILAEDGAIYTGCNVENAAFSPSICAERVAVGKAVSSGSTKFKVVAIVANQENSFTAPCGVCRQTLNEFRGTCNDIDIYLCKTTEDRVLKTTLSELLPLAFFTFKGATTSALPK